jgi:hypothetical protein
MLNILINAYDTFFLSRIVKKNLTITNTTSLEFKKHFSINEIQPAICVIL